MSSAVNITVVLNGETRIFRCYATMTVGWAEDEIRSKYCLQGGGITLDDVDQHSDESFEDMKDGELQFVDGERLAQAGGGQVAQGGGRGLEQVTWHKRDIQQDVYSPPPHETSTAWRIPHLSFAGLADIEHGIYVRKETEILWAALEGLGTGAGQKRGVWVSGPPGVGKSTEVYAWGMHWATRDGSGRRKMLWVHHSLDFSYNLVKIVDGSMVVASVKEKDDIVCILREGFDIVIFDAVRSDMKGMVLEALNDYPYAVIVACTSYQSGSINQELWAKYEKIFNFDYPVYSWTWEQYQAAHEAGVFGEVEIETLHEKFYYCGGCIRLMCREVDNAVHYIDKKLNEVNDKSVLLGGLAGVSSAVTVNSLVSVRPSHDGNRVVSFVLSQFVSRKLSLDVDDSFLEKMRHCNTNNPVWQGWVFEFHLLYRLRRIEGTNVALNLLSLDEADDPALQLLIRSVLTYSGPSPSQNTFDNNTLFIPEKWNQGCFDAVYFHERDGKRYFEFLNATVADRHVFKCQHMATFLNWAIGTPAARAPAPDDVKVTLYAVTPFNNRQRFKLNECEVIDVASVRNFDPSFNVTPERSLQLLHTGEIW